MALAVIVILFLGAQDGVAVGIQFRLGAATPAAAAGRGGHVHLIERGAVHFVIAVERAAEGRLEVDHVAQQDVFVEKFVTPDGDGLKRQRAFAEARDHRVAAGLDPLGDGNLALARQKFDRPHLAQIHADRIIGAVERFSRGADNGNFARGGGFHQFARDLTLLGLVILDDVDPHFRQHRHHVFDLFGGDLFRRKHGVELFIGDVAALARIGDHLLDRGLAHVERDVGFLLFGLRVVSVFECHGCSSGAGADANRSGCFESITRITVGERVRTVILSQSLGIVRVSCGARGGRSGCCRTLFGPLRVPPCPARRHWRK